MMTRNLKQLSLLLFVVASLAEVSWGCTLIVYPITKFDPSEYIFVGEVMRVVGPVKHKYISGEAYGLLVRVQGEVFLPRKPVNNFEVFPHKGQPDCSWVAWSKEELLKSYPIGSKVRVIGKEPLGIEKPRGTIRLWPTSPGGVANDNDANVWLKREYDYETYDRRDYGLPDFELRKDLLRLSRIKSEAGRIAILERLVHYPPLLIIDYSAIVKSHIRS